MPAVTPTEPKSLPAVADATGTPRPVEEVGNAVSTFEGGGFPVRRPFPGALDQTRTDPFLMLDQMGPIVYAPGQAVGAPDHPAPRVRDRHLSARRRGGAPRLLRRRRSDPRRRHAVDDRGLRPRALRDADREDDARGRAVARRAALGEPAAERQARRAALPGHHRRPADAVPQRRRHRDRAAHRGRSRGPARSGAHAHADRDRARDARAGRAPRARLAA